MGRAHRETLWRFFAGCMGSQFPSFFFSRERFASGGAVESHTPCVVCGSLAKSKAINACILFNIGLVLCE
jgi:hypothetical protein